MVRAFSLAALVISECPAFLSRRGIQLQAHNIFVCTMRDERELDTEYARESLTSVLPCIQPLQVILQAVPRVLPAAAFQVG